MEKILNQIVKLSGFTLSDVRDTCRKSELVAVRLLFAQEALKKGYHPTDIGKLINRDRSTVIQMKDYKPSVHYTRLKLLYKRTQWAILRDNYRKTGKYWATFFNWIEGGLK